MSLIGSLNTALSGLQTMQAALQTVSNNIANVNTEGYTRKVSQPQTLVVAGQAVGVELAAVQRTVDEQLLRQIRDHIAKLTGQQVQSGILDQTQNLFGSLADNSSVSHGLTEFGSAIEAMANAPESVVARNGVVDTARRLADQLNFMTDNLQRMRASTDREIAASIDRINGLLPDIDDVNVEIASGLAIGRPVGDLRDRRDLLIDQLAAEIDIHYFERTSGEVVITTSSGRTLLDSLPTNLGFTPSAQVAAGATLQNGLAGITYGTAGLDITGEIRSGRLDGLLTLRDETLVDLQAEIDRLAEALRDGINALHNDGTAFPAPGSLTGSRSVAATDAPAFGGNFRVAVVDAAGLVVEALDIDLTALAPPNVGQLVAQINAMANASASINANGQLVLTAAGGNGIAVNESDSAVATGNTTQGLAHFLGLNDLFVSGSDFDVYQSDRSASATAVLGLAGSLDFSVAGATTSVAYAAGDSLTDIATAINAALGGANIAATVVNEGSGFRLEIRDGDGDNFFLSDTGTLSGQLNLRAGQAGTAGLLEVRPAVLADPNLVARGELSSAVTLAVGDIAISAGDGSIARAMADAFTTDRSFAAAGGLPVSVTTLAGYAANILSLNAANASVLGDEIAFGESFAIALETQSAAISQVNLDEELAQLVVLQNAYAASARLTTTISELLDLLIEIV